MSTQPLTVPSRPVLTPDPVDLLIAEAEAYGPYSETKTWDERSPEYQQAIVCALRAFLNWRRRTTGADLGDDPWAMPPPSPEEVRLFVAVTKQKGKSWRERTAAALRLYFRHIERPDLFRLVEMRRGR